MAEKMPIRIRAIRVAVSTSYEYVQTEIVPPGEIWCLQGYQFENETGARGTIRLYIEGHGYNHYMHEQTSPSSGTLYPVDRILYLTPGERLTLRQASNVAGDVIALYSQGYKVHSKYIEET